MCLRVDHLEELLVKSSDEAALGYHVRSIPRGEYGEISKIAEEMEELKDAAEQGVTLMVLQEMSDMIGAMRGFLCKHHPTITLDDLIRMADATERAFNSGQRRASAQDIQVGDSA